MTEPDAAQEDLHFADLENGRIFENDRPFMTMIHLLKGNWGKLGLSILFFIIKASPTWVIPIVTANIINIVTNPESHRFSEVWLNLAVALLMVAQNVPTTVLYSKYLSLAMRKVEAELRSCLVRKLQILSISFHQQIEQGRLQSKFLRDVEAIIQLARRFFSSIAPIAINLIVALSITLQKSRMVALFFVISMPFSYLIIRYFRANIRRTNRAFRKEIEQMSARMAEMVEMVPVTRAHALEQVEIRRMDDELQEVRKRGYVMDIVTSFFGASVWVTFQILQMGCLAFTGYLAFTRRIQVGDVVLYQSYFSQILNQISALINVYPDIVLGFESVHSVGEIFLSGDVEDNRGKQKLSGVKGEIEFDHVDFHYPNHSEPVLKDFCLHVRQGECIAFVGESGAGKTTLLNLIIGFNRPTGGRILIDGKDLSQIHLGSYRRFLAVVPQNTLLFSGTIRENITYGLEKVDEEKLRQVVEAANLTSVIEQLPQGLDTSVGEHGGMLSGGQRQRIAIARALIRDPKIIVLDEATSSLDNASELHVQMAMANLVKGRTTFIVAHRLSTIRNADRIVVIKQGRCVECGTYEELMARKGEFYTLKKLQA